MKINALGILAMLAAIGGANSQAEPDVGLKLWYDSPANQWIEALPIGNGRLGAMVFGGVAKERLQFNDDTLWTGQPHEYQNPGAVKYLPDIRRLIAEGKQGEAETLAQQHFMSIPIGQKAYQPFGDLFLKGVIKF
jgi:alpha-L-fucosidase 2